MVEKTTIQANIVNVIKGVATIAVSIVSFVLVLWTIVSFIRVVGALFG